MPFNETQVQVMFQSLARAKANDTAAREARKITAERFLRIRNKAYEAIASGDVAGQDAEQVKTLYAKSTRGAKRQAIGADFFADELADLLGADQDDPSDD